MEFGYQFEWVWFLVWWGMLWGDFDVLIVVCCFYDIVWIYGIDESCGVVFMVFNDDFIVCDLVVWFWGQMEWIKVVIVFVLILFGLEWDVYLVDILVFCNVFKVYFKDVLVGFYWDKWQVDGSFVDELVFVSLFYYIVCVIFELNVFVRILQFV